MVQGGIDQCSISMSSLDAISVIRRYFATGKLPENQLTEVDTSIKHWDEKLELPDGAGENIWATVRTLARGFPRSLHGWAPEQNGGDLVTDCAITWDGKCFLGSGMRIQPGL